MKVFRTLLGIFLVLVIVGGLGYIGYSYYFMKGMNHNISMPNMPGMGTTTTQPNNSATTNHTQMAGVPNPVAIQNKDKLNTALAKINEAIELITIDPYARTTVPSDTRNAMNSETSSSREGVVNIYPSGSGPVTIYPSINGNTPSTNNGSTPRNSSTTTNMNFVYDQEKLQQLHSGIYTLAQGIMLMNQLNNDLNEQAAMLEANPIDYQTYLNRYNMALQNKTKLSSALNMLSQASTLIDVNPYTSPSGYQFNIQGMQQLHKGIFSLAQGIVLLSQFNNDLTNQLAQANYQMQSMSGMSGMNMHSGTTGWIAGLNLSSVITLVLIIMLLGLIIGILGAILNMVKHAKAQENRQI